eukprot:243299-Prymnesium_polylepis.1
MADRESLARFEFSSPLNRIRRPKLLLAPYDVRLRAARTGGAVSARPLRRTIRIVAECRCSRGCVASTTRHRRSW